MALIGPYLDDFLFLQDCDVLSLSHYAAPGLVELIFVELQLNSHTVFHWQVTRAFRPLGLHDPFAVVCEPCKQVAAITSLEAELVYHRALIGMGSPDLVVQYVPYLLDVRA